MRFLLLASISITTPFLSGGCVYEPGPFRPSREFRERRGEPDEPRDTAAGGSVGRVDVEASLPTTSLAQQLRRTPVRGFRVDDEESLRAVVERLAVVTGLPLVVDPRAEGAALDEGARFSFDIAHPLSARDVLGLVTEAAGPEVAWTIRHDAVLITTRARALEPSVVVAHDVGDLTFARTDFVAPRLDRIRLLDDLEDEDGYGPFGGEARSAPSVPEGDLVALVSENVEPGLWERDGVSITAENGFLIVVASRAVQARVRRLLDRLRAF